MSYTLKIYEARDRSEPLTEWLNSLKDQKARIAIRMRLDRMRLGNFGYCEAVGEGVSEMKVDLGPGYRVYFGMIGRTVVLLLCGGDKKTSGARWIFLGIISKERSKMPRYRNYNEELIEYLKDHDEAVAYLNAAWEESLKGDEESQQLFLLALRNVAEAQGGLGKLAQKVHIRREQLYRTLSPRGNPGLKIIRPLLVALGVTLRFI